MTFSQQITLLTLLVLTLTACSTPEPYLTINTSASVLTDQGGLDDQTDVIVQVFHFTNMTEPATAKITLVKPDGTQKDHTVSASPTEGSCSFTITAIRRGDAYLVRIHNSCTPGHGGNSEDIRLTGTVSDFDFLHYSTAVGSEYVPPGQPTPVVSFLPGRLLSVGQLRESISSNGQFAGIYLTMDY